MFTAHQHQLKNFYRFIAIRQDSVRSWKIGIYRIENPRVANYQIFEIQNY